ncbi:hypothetical protein [uncultured Treponema sp.]|uniref:hypothetical protein n=1 Tax=uncultured Treponema sp. TaxID=162155 RepID=UPI002599ABF5|nr:hypothetical protein [uncultured Treponema sp.]
MKKTIPALLIMFLSFSLYAKSDAGVFLNTNTALQWWSKDGTKSYRMEKSPSANITLSNYNLFLFKNHFGIFETVHLLFEDDFSADMYIGIAAGTELSPRVRIQGGPAFHLYNNSITKSGTFYNNTYIGFGSDLQAKVQLWRFISAAAGFTLSLDPYWLELSKESGKWYYAQNKDFLNLAFNGYIGIVFDF